MSMSEGPGYHEEEMSDEGISDLLHGERPDTLIRHEFSDMAQAVIRWMATTTKPMAVAKYQVLTAEAEKTFGNIAPRWRLRLAEVSDLIAQALCVCGFVIWSLTLAHMQFASLSIVSSAFAANGDTAVFDPKPYIYLAIFVALLISFAVSMFVQYFSRSTKAQDSAGTVTKLLLGFFVGAGTKYLGV